MKKVFQTIFSKTNRAHFLCGILLGAVTFFYCSTFFSRKAGAVFGAAYVVLGLVKIKTSTKTGARILNLLWGIAGISVLVFLSPLVGILSLGMQKVVLNYLCILFVAELLFALTARYRLSVSLTVIALGIFFLVNTAVYQFRGKELCVQDFLSLGTALSVAQQYSLQVSFWMAYFCCILGLWLFAQFSFSAGAKFPGRHPRLTGLVLLAATSLAIFFGAENVPVQTWSVEGSRQNGYCLNFYLGVRTSFVSKPENYSGQLIEDCAEEICEEAPAPEQVLPDIVVIMDESFADFGVFENAPETNVSITPFLDSLSENTVRGYALSSAFGGNTVNAEFEFLTGHSMAFLPENCVPYQQYISDNIYSLAWLLRSYGYSCTATHPYHAEGYSRSEILPRLGFEETIFIDRYPCRDMLRVFVSDREVFECILGLLDTQERSGPAFIFGITMQNHGGYTYAGEEYHQAIEITEGPADAEAEQYLSLLHESDKAVEYLLTQLEKSPRETLVLFFGDHMPKLDMVYYEAMNAGAFDSLDEKMKLYTVPFFIWANYDIEEGNIPLVSMNYLSKYLLEASGIALPAYYQLLSEIEETVPVLSANGYYSLQEQRFVPVEYARDAEARTLEWYKILQYNNLFDPDGRNSRLYGQYLPSRTGEN